MHEASAAEALVKMASAEAVSRGSPRVLKIVLVVGEASGYMEDSLAMFLKVLAKDSPVEGAELEIRHMPALLRCSVCDKEFERKRFSFECPHCGGQGVMTKKGSEFYIDSLELETPPNIRN